MVDDEGLDETTGIREHRRAEENVTTAAQDVQRSAGVLKDWSSVWGEFQSIYEKNGFGESMVKIMRAPARGT